MIRQFALAAFFSAVSAGAQAHWTRLYPAASPSARSYASMCFHGASGRTILFGGNGGGSFGDTWAFDGTSWAPRASGPSPRSGSGMAYDEARGVLVMFGGSPYSDETWEWNGTSWTLRSTPVRPLARHNCAMAYDRVRQVTVLFGGYASGIQYAGDTWEWNGVDWQDVSPVTSPAARAGARAAFDPTLGGVLLFGGNASGQPPMTHTWRWDGIAWQQLLPPNMPPWRVSHGMVADVSRRRVVLFGGDPYDPFAWEWDGQTWEMRVLASPSPRTEVTMAYDSVRRQVVLFGGSYSSSKFNDTWIYATDDPATFETIGAGCLGTTGTPELHHAPYSLPWTGDTFDIRCLLVPSNTPVIFATGFEAPAPVALDPFGMPGCEAHVTVLETQFTLSDPTGTAHWSLAIPNAPALAGVELAQQALVVDPPVNAAGAVVSTAVKFTIGIR